MGVLHQSSKHWGVLKVQAWGVAPSEFKHGRGAPSEFKRGRGVPSTGVGGMLNQSSSTGVGEGSICLPWQKSNLTSESKCSNLRSNLKTFMIALSFVR